MRKQGETCQGDTVSMWQSWLSRPAVSGAHGLNHYTTSSLIKKLGRVKSRPEEEVWQKASYDRLKNKGIQSAAVSGSEFTEQTHLRHHVYPELPVKQLKRQNLQLQIFFSSNQVNSPKLPTSSCLCVSSLGMKGSISQTLEVGSFILHKMKPELCSG